MRIKPSFLLLSALSLTMILSGCGESGQSSSSFSDDSSSPYSSSAEEWALPEEVSERLSALLGASQELGNSPFPIIEGAAYALADGWAISASGVSKGDYIEALVMADFSAEVGDVYVDPLGNYAVSLSGEDDSLLLTFSFMDEPGDFPVHFLAASIPSMDLSSYLDPETFMFSENVLGEDLNAKFRTISTETFSPFGIGMEHVKYVTYTPKADDDEPLEALAEWLEDSNFQSISSSSYQFIDLFGGSLVTLGTVASSDSALVNAGAKAGDVYLCLFDAYTVDFDESELSSSYEYYVGSDYPEGYFPDFGQIGKGHGLMLGFSSSNTYGPGWYINKASRKGAQAVIDYFYDAGWRVSQSNGDYYYTFNLYDYGAGYHLIMTYMDHNAIGGLLNDVCFMRIFKIQSLDEALSSWLRLQGQGGGSLRSIPEVPASQLSYTSGTATSSGNPVPYFRITGVSMTEANLDAYEAALVADGWKLFDEETNTYASSDGFYYFTLTLSETGSFTGYLQYDTFHYSGSHTYSEIMGYAALRLGVNSIAVPGLSSYMGETATEMDIASLYYSYQRFLAYLPVADADAATELVDTLYDAVAADASWTMAGTNSGGTITFYEKDNVYLYFTTGTGQTADGTETNFVVIGLYYDE